MVVTLIAIAFLGAVLVVSLTPRWTLAWAVGLAVLAAVAVVASSLEPGQVAVGSTLLEVDGPARSFIAAIATGGLLVGLIAATASLPPATSAGLLVAVAACALAVVAPDPILALWAVAGGGTAVLLAGALAAPEGQPGGRDVRLDAPLRAVAGSGAAGVFGLALAVPPLVSPAPDAGMLGLAYLALGFALAARLASVPLHRWAARLTDSTPVPLLAATIVWLPVAFATVAAGWATGPLAAAHVDLGAERSAVLVVGLATMVLAAIAALIRDDLGHVTAYLAISDLGLAVVAFAVPDPTVSASIGGVLVALAASKTALIGWLVALETAFGTRRLADLDGWVRRAPLLGFALALIAAATVGWPGSPVLSARLDVVRAAAPPIAPLAAIGTFAALAPCLRILAVGLRPAHGAVASSVTGRLRRPAAFALADAGRLRERAAAGGRDLRGLWSLNRRPAAAVGALALALVAVAVSGGASWPVPPAVGQGRVAAAASSAAVPRAVATGAASGQSASGQSAGASTQRSTSRS